MKDRSMWASRVPLLIAASVIVLISGFNLYRLVSAQAPRNPWESSEIVEAWRSLHGMPVYELPPSGHATHMYGALVPWVQGKLFRLIGPNNVSGRALSLGSALLMVTVIALSMRGRGSAFYFAIGWAAILGLNHRSGQYFAENRPDMPALLLATVAMVFFYHAQSRWRFSNILLGSTCLVAGFFFKQTVWVFSVVPLVALVFRQSKPRRVDVFFAAIPLVISVAVIVALKFLNPAVYHYMIKVPAGYAINWPRAVKFVWEMLLDSPLFLFLLGEWVVFDQESLRKDPRMQWLFAILAVAIPFCAVSHAKIGGWPNSELPALLGMMAFCALRLPGLLERLECSLSSRSHRLLYGSFLSLLLLMTIFPHITYANNLFVPKAAWDEHYWQAVEVTRGLSGTVVCPEDPTIPLYARRYAGQNLFIEKDARPSHGLWPVPTPEPVIAEIRSADYVVDVANYWGDNLDERLLEELGFERASGFSINADCYQIWRRGRGDRAGSGNRTALLDKREP